MLQKRRRAPTMALKGIKGLRFNYVRRHDPVPGSAPDSILDHYPGRAVLALVLDPGNWIAHCQSCNCAGCRCHCRSGNHFAGHALAPEPAGSVASYNDGIEWAPASWAS